MGGCARASLLTRKGCGAAQAVPSLGAQAVTLAAWCGSRAILYSSYYAIVAALVGFRWSSCPRLLLPGNPQLRRANQ